MSSENVTGDQVERVAGGDPSAAADRRTDLTGAMSRLEPRDRAMLWLA